MTLLEPTVGMPQNARGAAAPVTRAQVTVVNADGTVDVSLANSRAGRVAVPAPTWWIPAVGDQVLLTNIDGDQQRPVIVAPISTAAGGIPGLAAAPTGVTAPRGTVFEADADGAPTGLTGTMGLRILQGTSTIVARTTAGITEYPAGSGRYVKNPVAPAAAGRYQLMWDTGTVSPATTSYEDLIVT